MRDIPLEERIIFALDVPTAEEALRWEERLRGRIRFFKVGLELFLAGGWPVVEELRARGNRVMLDLKFYDIPETVAAAVAQLSGRGVSLATIHGNGPIIQAAVGAKGDVRLLAVTVLTSFDRADMEDLGFRGNVGELVELRARRALELGCDGVVSSPLEVGALRRSLGHGFLAVTPGVRPAHRQGRMGYHQRRVATPGEAVAQGADYLVVGRPIREANDPIGAVEEMQTEIARALESRGRG